TDPDHDPLHLTYSITKPIGVHPTLFAVQNDMSAVRFTWPATSSLVEIKATALDGKTGADGVAAQGSGVADIGASPPPLSIHIGAPNGGRPAGGTFSLPVTDSNGSSAGLTVQWTQLSGPSLNLPASSAGTLTVHVPAGIPSGSAAVLQAVASRGGLVNGSSGTTTITVPLGPQPPPSIQLPTGLHVDPGGTLPIAPILHGLAP